MGTTIFVIVLVLIVAATIAVRVFAVQQADVHTPLSPDEVRLIIEGYFRPALWSRVNGPGQLNLKPKLKAHAPTMSIKVDPNGTGSDVSAWTSAYTTRYGIVVYHGELMIRKRRGLMKRLQAPAGALPAA